MTLKSKQRNPRQHAAALQTSMRSMCVKIVRRHHLTLHWVPTLSPLGCDTNKPGGQGRHYPWSSQPAGVSFTGSGLHWPGLGSSRAETARLSGVEPGERKQ